MYVRKTPWYLSLQKQRDVIEKPVSDGLDLSGWDVSKALFLLVKSNPPLLEWLQSPIVYRETFTIVSRIRKLMPEYYSPKSCLYHYLHMARGNYRQYLQGDTVWVKKYFYVLRPILACIWIESGYGLVPTEFNVLADRVLRNSELKEPVDDLLIKKKAGNELDMGDRIPVLSDFLDNEIRRLSVGHGASGVTVDFEKLDRVFVEILKEINGQYI